MTSPVAVLHRWIASCGPTDANILPLGDHANALMNPCCWATTFGSSVTESHRIRSPSAPPEAMSFPSGDQDTVNTESSCPIKGCALSFSTEQMQIASFLEAKRNRPFGDQLTADVARSAKTFDALECGHQMP